MKEPFVVSTIVGRVFEAALEKLSPHSFEK